jgi:hypothetical protein
MSTAPGGSSVDPVGASAGSLPREGTVAETDGRQPASSASSSSSAQDEPSTRPTEMASSRTELTGQSSARAYQTLETDSRPRPSRGGRLESAVLIMSAHIRRLGLTRYQLLLQRSQSLHRPL